MTTEQAVVLVVEQDPLLLDRIGAWLEAEGHEVMACRGPSAPDYVCIAERGASCPLVEAADAVVLDLWLASDRDVVGTSAGDLLVRYLSRGKPVVVLSMLHDDDGFLRFASDPVAVIEWPPERRDLCETVNAVLRATAGRA